MEDKLKKTQHLLSRLTKIGISISAEKDVYKLLTLILEESMKITSSDGGSLYIIEDSDSDKNKKQLRFKISRNSSRVFPFQEFVMPLNRNSISGYTGLTGESLLLNDMKELPKRLGFQNNDSFAQKINYKTINMLVIPLKDYSGRVIGVLQLLNKKPDYSLILEDPSTFLDIMLPYTSEEEEIIMSLGSQVAILLERNKLYDEINLLFSSFVETMVATIDARDPTTSGHSKRVATYSVKMAETINNINYGKYADIHFTEEEIKELYYSALLHDIGKIGVSESVLLKKNRLTDDKIDSIKYRFNYLYKSLELKKYKEDITKEELDVYNNIFDYLDFIVDINEKGFVSDENIEKIKSIYNIEFVDIDGKAKTLLTPYEFKNLSIQKGTLTSDERNLMNSHASHTFEILKNIPWIRGLEEVPNYARKHHEKLDGTGYPEGLDEKDIPIQSRMLAILDCFEALTAFDRPYKPPLPIPKTLQILESDVKFGKLDKDLFEIFKNEEVYNKK